MNLYNFIKKEHNIDIDGQKLFKHFSKSSRVKYMIFVDAESDGLWGEAFCVSLIVIDVRTGEIVENFTKKANIPIKEKWVQENVLPVIKYIPSCNTTKELRNDFWEVWEKYRKYAITFADSGFPVEANWFKTCIEDDMENRQNQSPYPLHDVSTTVLLSGIGNVKRKSYARLHKLIKGNLQHNPYYDNVASAITFLLASSQLWNNQIMK